jgi:hypothetical protein
VAFALLAVVHAALAANAESTAIERWRNLLLWPALAAGFVASLSSRGQHWSLLLLLIWTLGEAAAAVLACWYAPSLGEPPTLRANRYVLIAGLVSLIGSSTVLVVGRRSSPGWTFFIAQLLLLLTLLAVCLVRTIPSDAQPSLMGLAALRFALLVYLGNRWLKNDATKTGEEPASPVVASANL